jgi:hypothetical protein
VEKWGYACQAFNPESKSTRAVGIKGNVIQTLVKQGHVAKLARLALVKEVLKEPVKIVEGWNRPNTDKHLVYIGNPDKDYRSGSIVTPPPPDLDFVVYIMEDGTIDDWNWRKSGGSDSELPEGIEGVLKWSKN